MKITFIILHFSGTQWERTVASICRLPDVCAEVCIVSSVVEFPAYADRVLLEKFSSQPGSLLVYSCLPDQEGAALLQAIDKAQGDYICIAVSGCEYFASPASQTNEHGLSVSPAMDAWIIPCVTQSAAGATHFSTFYKQLSTSSDPLIPAFHPGLSFSLYSAYCLKRERLMGVLKNTAPLEALSLHWIAITLVFSVLLDVRGAGILSDCSAEISAHEKVEQTATTDSGRAFTDFWRKGFPFLLRYARLQNGTVPRWLVQNLLRYFLEWIKHGFSSELSLDEHAGRCDIGRDVLACIDDAELKEHPQISVSLCLFLLEKKYGTAADCILAPSNRLYLRGHLAIGSSARLPVYLDFLRFHNEYLEIEGRMTTLHPNDTSEIVLLCDGTPYACEELSFSLSETWMGEAIKTQQSFRGRLPSSCLRGQHQIYIAQNEAGVLVRKRNLRLGKYMPIDSAQKTQRFKWDDRILSFDPAEGCLLITESSTVSEPASKARPLKELHLINSPRLKSLLIHAIIPVLKATLFRKGVWLVSDRINRADDNGEVLFEYLSSHRELLKGRRVYFVLDKKSPDAKRVRCYGRIVTPLSWKHKLLHLLSEYVISSQGNNPVVNPFYSFRSYYVDLLQNERFVFLQHGVTKDDQSKWLNKYNRNIWGLVVATLPEYASILEYNYGYEKDNVWLTGMPRFDKLYHDEKKYVTIMPTWRKALSAGTDPQTSLWILADGFENSDYFRFYNELLNHDELISFAKEHGYTLCFMPHPNILPYVKDYFHQNENVVFWDEAKSYRSVFAETNLLVTDYSSVAFDFAYLRKPILYCQFDREAFFNGSHSYTEGYFDYERDGFGEIAPDLEETVRKIREYIENDCSLPPKYLERINHTFAFEDTRNCERVLQKLLNT